MYIPDIAAAIERCGNERLHFRYEFNAGNSIRMGAVYLEVLDDHVLAETVLLLPFYLCEHDRLLVADKGFLGRGGGTSVVVHLAGEAFGFEGVGVDEEGAAFAELV